MSSRPPLHALLSAVDRNVRRLGTRDWIDVERWLTTRPHQKLRSFRAGLASLLARNPDEWDAIAHLIDLYFEQAIEEPEAVRPSLGPVSAPTPVAFESFPEDLATDPGQGLRMHPALRLILRLRPRWLPVYLSIFSLLIAFGVVWHFSLDRIFAPLTVPSDAESRPVVAPGDLHAIPEWMEETRDTGAPTTTDGVGAHP